jgi:hypothetical protein
MKKGKMKNPRTMLPGLPVPLKPNPKSHTSPLHSKKWKANKAIQKGKPYFPPFSSVLYLFIITS